MSERQCYTCKETKPLEEFPRSKKEGGGHRYQCKACKYLEEKRRGARRGAQHRRRERGRVVLERGSCLRCGESDAAALDFHHLDPSAKNGEVARMARSGAAAKARAEAAKCVILCANCHRKLHARRFTITEDRRIVDE